MFKESFFLKVIGTKFISVTDFTTGLAVIQLHRATIKIRLHTPFLIFLSNYSVIWCAEKKNNRKIILLTNFLHLYMK